MSLDPPSNTSFSHRTQSVASMQDIMEEHGGVKDSMSISRDPSMSPGRQLRVRSSLTPQPSGSDFDLVVPPPRERDPSQPPPLATLMSQPTFVKPPPNLQKSDVAETAKQLTLGSLVDAQRSAHPTSRHSSILFGTSSATDVSARPVWPTNAAEKALHELEVYKTPLLPTRLRASGTIPDMFFSKKSHPITLMTDDREEKPRLGMKGKVKERGKKKDKETPNGSKPYAGEGGMKKLLARRRMEEEQAKEKEKMEAMLDQNTGEERRKRAAEEKEKERVSELQVPPPSPPRNTLQPETIRGRETSSLRVGRTKTGRNHIERPVSRRMKKFSAVFEDEDEEMDDGRAAEHKMLEEAAKKAPVFEIPPGFTFPKDVTITHDATSAKEPPISSLPFSLTKSTITTSSTPLSGEPVAKSEAVSEPSVPVPTLPAATITPPVFLSPPTPKNGAAAASAPAAVTLEPVTSKIAPPAAAPSSIPNFFANSSLLSKPTSAAAAAPLSFSVTPSQTTQVTQIVTVGEQKPDFEEPVIIEQPMSAPTVPPSVPSAPLSSTSSGTSMFGAPSTSTAPPAVPLFGATTTTETAVSSSGPLVPSAAPKEPEAGASPKPALSPFTFDAPKPAQASLPAPTEPPVAAEAAAGTSAAQLAAPFSFNLGAPAKPATTAEVPKSTFSFGPPTATATPAGPGELQAAKPPFSGQSSAAPTFSFGQGTENAKEDKPTSGPFSFVLTPAQPTAETKAAPTPTTSAPTFTFSPSSGSNAADVSSKPFSFTPTTPVRPATPPKVELEVNMDESPTREMNPNSSGKAPERPTLNLFAPPNTSGSALFAQSPATPAPPFSFGTSTVNPFAKDAKADEKPKPSFGFGQTTSTGFGQKAPESPTVSSPAPFMFSQPSPSAAPTSPFTFGAPSSMPFSQASAAAPSAPASPSAFNRPASTPAFTFGPSAATQPSASSFVFGSGSQPASPANNNANLPSGSTGSTFMFNPPSGATPAPPNPFNTPSSTAPPTAGGGSLFTIGSAPPPEAGGRQIKKLPRRGGARR
ncbi:hypothetical protein PISMIDRAFT_684376 [Pisolithus microcarpus 441]|uniref:Uncharacterized protein n=1 Tax=Pisolithus microcarpus 441 TaxID=765257 RepID=A0A0C9YWI3_9AGAM|nr:hypothetical protein PISMIDRAFT_684376 [Pisolithus microcarpus 441]